ncbi:MAG: hypothetical protein IJM97_08060 [Clostridia bacterium]|nr:hypothetical protein [Clostridia bacterium]
MPIYKIAGFTVSMEPKYEPLVSQVKPYLINDTEDVQITLSLPDEFLEKKHQENPHLDIGSCEYIFYGVEFYYKLLDFNGFLLHSSAIEYEGNAYLFSAPSGTGKSTHTSLWVKKFGEDKVKFINDDKPVILFKDGKIYACGTPFSGKTNLSENVCVPIKGICFLHRSPTNEIKRCESKDALKNIMNQTVRPANAVRMSNLLSMIDKLMKNVPIFEMGCNMSTEAAEVSYSAMSEI